MGMLALAPLLTVADQLDDHDWPGAEQRQPDLSARNYLSLSALAEHLQEEVQGAFGDRNDLDALDVGCGDKPYLPLVASRCSTYRGLDFDEGPVVDDIGSAEALPYPNASFDLVLCTQVLEHLDQPLSALREVHRVLRPGGLALISTHGVHVFHPDPPSSGRDYWRWTHAGLERLIREAGDWTTVSVRPQGNVIACLVMLVLFYFDGPARRFGSIGAGLIAVINFITARADARFPRKLRVPSAGSIAANYLASARR
jgi:SAM-dependent methyltransferase